jgi:hypothetical protein
MLNFRQIYLSLLLGFVILPFSVFAQEKKTTQSSPNATQSSASKNTQKKSGNKVIEFNQLSLEGRIRRPSASYLLQRKKLKFKGLEPKKSFMPQILQSVKKSPF